MPRERQISFIASPDEYEYLKGCANQTQAINEGIRLLISHKASEPGLEQRVQRLEALVGVTSELVFRSLNEAVSWAQSSDVMSQFGDAVVDEIAQYAYSVGKFRDENELFVRFWRNRITDQ